MLTDTQSQKINKKFLLATAICSLFMITVALPLVFFLTVICSLFMIMVALPLVFFSAEIAVGLAMIPLIAIAVKITAKAGSNAIQENNINHSTETQGNFSQEKNMNQDPIIQDKVRNAAIGSIAVLVGGIALLIMAKTGLIVTCVAIAAVASYECTKNEGIGKNVNASLDKAANDVIEFIVDNKATNNTIKFIVSNVENYTSQARA